MDDDLEEFREIFLEECLENVELLERGLMQMDAGESTADILNEVFRAAHSIKGGGATFGYQPMAELTHFMETLLDEMRSERRAVVADDVDLLLEGLDLVQAILTDSKEQSISADNDGRLDLQLRLQASVDSAEPRADAPEETEAAIVVEDEMRSWKVTFAPFESFFLRGNNPLLLIRELQRLGGCTITKSFDKYPGWSDFDPNNCYLTWVIDISSTSVEADIREVFDWVDTECELTIEQIESSPAENVAAVVEETPEVVAAVVAPAPAAAPAPVASKKPAPAAAEKKPSGGGADTSTIRIATDKIDQLIDLVGELVITQSMLSRVCQSQDQIDVAELRERMADLEYHTRDLQESVMQVRMLPISSAFNRLPRLVRDLSKKLDKEIDLILEGETTELDKTVLERMIDPLVHLVRNGVDHGLETREERIASGKPVAGQLKLNARQESGSIIIDITDDGKGVNPEVVLRKARENGIVGDEELSVDQINQLIFAPGFSTAEVVSDVSGRGVGMDVVRRNILDLGGRVHVHSTLGAGTRVEINLPLSLAILDGQLVRIAGQVYVIPMLSIIETLEIANTERSTIPGTGDVFQFRGEYLSMLDVSEFFCLPDGGQGELIVVVENHGKRVGLVIDEVLGQQQVVIKSLDKNYKNIEGCAGATIMSDGLVALILDPANFNEPAKLAAAA